MLLEDFKHIIFGEELSIKGDLSKEEAEKFFNPSFLTKKSNEFRAIPIDKIFNVLECTGEKLCNKNGYYYKKMIETLPQMVGYSSNMVEEAISILKELLTINSLKERLKSLGDYHCIDNFVKKKNSKLLRAIPVGSVLHVAAGNIFLGSIDSLIIGIITKNINILKVSSQDFFFPSLFYKALEETDIEKVITPYIAITYWHSSNKDLDKIAKNNFDAILLFGGEEAVRSYKDGLSVKTQLYSFGPKISFGLVCKSLSDADLKTYAEGFADDIVFWEQRACTSCQAIFIEKSNKIRDFVQYLYQALEEKGIKFPQTYLDLDSAIEIRKKKELTKWDEFNNNALLLEGKSSNHTIIMTESNNLPDSPLNRTIYINVVKSYTDIFEGNLTHLKYYMSTLSIAASEKIQNIIEDFMNFGIMRFCKPGSMSKSEDGSLPHDGIYIPNLLVRFINKENFDINQFGLEYKKSTDKENILLWRLNSLIKEALKSPFYKDLYKNITMPLKSLEDFARLPILEKKHLYEHSIDKNHDMLTQNISNYYVFSAGGTTGKMKYVAYSTKEFQESKKVIGQGYVNLGVTKNDFVANYMKAGALWTAFPAVNDGLEETGCKILSLTANQSEKETIEYIKTFKPNAIVSLPGNIVLLAQEIEKLGEHINIDKIFYAGEHISPNAEAYIRKILHAKIIRSFGYAAVEIGPIGFQCNCCKGTEHHVEDDWCYVERDTNGDILVTSLYKTLQPIIRYRLGDSVEWVDEPCSCGRTSKKFKLLSRTDDVVRLNVSDIYLSDVYNSLKDIEEISPFFQVLVDNANEMRNITFKVEAKNSDILINNNMLKNKILTSLKSNIPSIGADYKKNLIKDIRVELLPPFGIERIGRTGKIRRIIDRR